MRVRQTMIAFTFAATTAMIQLSAQDPQEERPESATPGNVAGAAGSADLLDQLLDNATTPQEPTPRLKQGAEGEDIQPGGGANPVLRVGQLMTRAQQQLRRRETSQPTQRLQKDIVRELDAMIAAAEQQAGQAGARQPRDRRSEASREGSAAATRPAGTAGGPASPSAAQQRDSDDAWMARIWGHLPDRLRQQIQTPVHEEFLPAYEHMITEYYKRLAEVTPR